VLELAGYAVVEQVGGTDWVEASRQTISSLAGVVLDLGFFLDGIADVARLHSDSKEVPPVLVLTTSQQIYDALASMQHVVLKPFHIHELLMQVQKMMGGETARSSDIPR
jgi:DNA-binding response OmpR family regulator